MIISATQGVLGLASGVLVGFSLGLVGGGGSILAVPLMVYVVGVPEPHVAIGTSAIAVAANAAINLSNHARGGTVVWSCALTFAAAGMVGAFGGSILGKMMDGQKLLALFALVMIVIALLMLKTRSRIGLPDVKISMSNMPAIVGLGLATGTMSGFFGIGGGFLIVPALMLATGMPIMNAVSSSLVAVTAFGLTTAASYAWSGLVSWALAGLFVAGGIAGGLAGTRSARHLAERRGALNIVFAVVIIAVALYMLARNISLSLSVDRGCRPCRETQMKRSNNPAGTNPGCTRREALGLLGGGPRCSAPLRCATGVRARRRRGADRGAGAARPGYPCDRQSRRRHHHRRMVRLQLPVLPQDRARDRGRWCRTTARSDWC